MASEVHFPDMAAFLTRGKFRPLCKTKAKQVSTSTEWDFVTCKRCWKIRNQWDQMAEQRWLEVTDGE